MNCIKMRLFKAIKVAGRQGAAVLLSNIQTPGQSRVVGPAFRDGSVIVTGFFLVGFVIEIGFFDDSYGFGAGFGKLS